MVDDGLNVTSDTEYYNTLNTGDSCDSMGDEYRIVVNFRRCKFSYKWPKGLQN